MIFYNKKFPVAVCILKVFVCIHKGCTLVFKLNAMGFPPHGWIGAACFDVGRKGGGARLQKM